MVANSAFAVIKKTVENTRDVTKAASSISKFIAAEDQLRADLHKKKNSIWTNFLGKQDSDLEEFMALEQIRKKQDQLREFMQLYGRSGLYNDYVAFCAEARKKRKEAILAAKKKQEQMIMWTLVGIGVLCSLWVVFYVIWKAMGN